MSAPRLKNSSSLWIGRNEQGGVSFHVISTTKLPSGNSGRKETPPMVKIEEEGSEGQEGMVGPTLDELARLEVQHMLMLSNAG
jgi:hypothetical protein